MVTQELCPPWALGIPHSTGQSEHQGGWWAKCSKWLVYSVREPRFLASSLITNESYLKPGAAYSKLKGQARSWRHQDGWNTTGMPWHPGHKGPGGWFYMTKLSHAQQRLLCLRVMGSVIMARIYKYKTCIITTNMSMCIYMRYSTILCWLGVLHSTTLLLGLGIGKI